MDLAAYYDERVVLIVDVILNVGSVLSTLLFALTVYLVVKKSAALGKYSRYMLNGFVWSYFHGTMLTMAKLFYLFPVPGYAYNVGFSVSDTLGRIFFVVLIGMFVNMWLSIALSTAFRLSQVFTGSVYRFFNETKTIYVVYLVVHLIAYVHVAVICIHFTGQKKAHEIVEQLLPQLVPYVADRALMVFPATKASIEVYAFIGWCFVILATLSTGTFTAFFLTAYRIRRLNRSVASLRKHMMFLRALAVQASILTVCMCSYAVSLFLGWMGVPRSGPIATAMLALMGTHSCFDMLATLYFVAPYRRYIVDTIARSGHATSETDQPVRQLCSVNYLIGCFRVHTFLVLSK